MAPITTTGWEQVTLGDLKPGDVIGDPDHPDWIPLTVTDAQRLGPVVIIDFDDNTALPPHGIGTLVWRKA